MTTADVKKEFGAAVRAHRLRLGISQESLAERAELHRTYVTDVERGARNLSLESISRLARALDLSISSLFAPARSTRGERGFASTTAQTSAELLLVEDNIRDIELTLAAFSQVKLSNRLEVVRDGEAALDYLHGRGSFAHRKHLQAPLVVLLDLGLPKLHGLEVLKRLRAEPKTKTQQVVVLTNSRSDASIREALEVGADAFIVKPLDFQSLGSVIPRLKFSWLLLHPSNPQPTLKPSGERA